VKHYGRESLEAVVSRFILRTCLLGSHGSVPLTLIILEGSIDVLTCISPMALGDGLPLDLPSLFASAILRGHLKSF
jgi:hypothetical protein